MNAAGLSFFLNPFWQKFVGRRIIVLSLSEPEHRLRDARTIIALRQFLPPMESGLTTYLTVTIGGREAPHWPDEVTASPETGLVLVGRPALFGEEAMSFLATCTPELVYSFSRNDCPDQELQTRRNYRAIVAPLGTKRRFQSELFDESRRQRPRLSRLKDLGIVYSGWKDSRPVAVFGGSSTVSTWGSAVWSMQAPGVDDRRWFQDSQGVIEASVANTPRAFQTVQADVHENQLLTPVSIWMDGRDLPPVNAWKEAVSARTLGIGDIRIQANGERVFPQLRGYIIPLVLLAWMNHRRKQHPTGIVQASCTTAEVLGWIDAFLGRKNAMGSRKSLQPNVNRILNEAVCYFNEKGGLATVDDNTRPSLFTLWFREPPSFLPTFRL